MAKLSSVKQSTKKEAQGVWVKWEQGIQLKIARAGNPVFNKISEEFFARNRALKEEGSPEVPLSVLELDLLAPGTLLDWKNVEDEDGKPLIYTPEEGKKVLSDPAYADLKLFVQQQSIFRQNFLEKGDQTTEKNSVPLSSQILKSAETSGELLKNGERAITQDAERLQSES